MKILVEQLVYLSGNFINLLLIIILALALKKLILKLVALKKDQSANYTPTGLFYEDELEEISKHVTITSKKEVKSSYDVKAFRITIPKKELRPFLKMMEKKEFRKR